ncbi:HXXEE domain-containing protein [Roseimicrobium sp. ORNL1]|uniref:HXXEE domain-containing protein n=1 Tax=Roseimicrobium sp. ORNL1 TaxID=2711231 RepID=UPI0013E12593|nr:HXXEE domain-containing protein [Roseimicrobium sp. ORNL1]QIF02717.1 HXXEE domain-containing protein [Roseimicrobium sp. ORNL1]
MTDPELPNWNWFYLNFPWIGGAAAIVLLILLFCTNLLRADQSRPRWLDYTWLSWMGLLAYLLHNIEEYGADMFGRLHQFPKDIVRIMELPSYPDCPIPPLYFVAVNVTMFWIAAPLASILSRRHPLVGLSVYSIIMVNAVVHIVPSVAGAGYGAGTLTAAVIFIPLSIWMIRACFGPGRMSYATLALLVAAGILAHAVLMVPMLLFLKGTIGSTLLVLLQVMNPFLLMLTLWLGERWRGGSLVHQLPHADEGA